MPVQLLHSGAEIDSGLFTTGKITTNFGLVKSGDRAYYMVGKETTFLSAPDTGAYARFRAGLWFNYAGSSTPNDAVCLCAFGNDADKAFHVYLVTDATGKGTQLLIRAQDTGPTLASGLVSVGRNRYHHLGIYVYKAAVNGYIAVYLNKVLVAEYLGNTFVSGSQIQGRIVLGDRSAAGGGWEALAVDDVYIDQANDLIPPITAPPALVFVPSSYTPTFDAVPGGYEDKMLGWAYGGDTLAESLDPSVASGVTSNPLVANVPTNLTLSITGVGELPAGSTLQAVTISAATKQRAAQSNAQMRLTAVDPETAAQSASGWSEPSTTTEFVQHRMETKPGGSAWSSPAEVLSYEYNVSAQGTKQAHDALPAAEIPEIIYSAADNTIPADTIQDGDWILIISAGPVAGDDLTPNYTAVLPGLTSNYGTMGAYIFDSGEGGLFYDVLTWRKPSSYSTLSPGVDLSTIFPLSISTPGHIMVIRFANTDDVTPGAYNFQQNLIETIEGIDSTTYEFDFTVTCTAEILLQLLLFISVQDHYGCHTAGFTVTGGDPVFGYTKSMSVDDQDITVLLSQILAECGGASYLATEIHNHAEPGEFPVCASDLSLSVPIAAGFDFAQARFDGVDLTATQVEIEAEAPVPSGDAGEDQEQVFEKGDPIPGYPDTVPSTGSNHPEGTQPWDEDSTLQLHGEIRGNKSWLNGKDGFYLYELSDIMFSQNMAYDNSQEQDQLFDNIVVAGDSRHNYITGNKAYSGISNSRRTAVGFVLEAGTIGNFIYGNDWFLGGAVAAEVDSGSNNLLFGNRIAEETLDNTTSGGGIVLDLDDLTDVDTAGAVEGSVLKYDADLGVWVVGTDNTGDGGATALNDLTDVDTSGAIVGSVLKYNGTTWVVGTDLTGGGGVTDIDDLSDVDTTTTAPEVGQVLTWDGTNWVPAEPTGGEGENLIWEPLTTGDPDNPELVFLDGEVVMVPAGYPGGGGPGGTIAWGDVTDKPTEFPPEAHTHVLADITDYVPVDLTEILHRIWFYG